MEANLSASSQMCRETTAAQATIPRCEVQPPLSKHKPTDGQNFLYKLLRQAYKFYKAKYLLIFTCSLEKYLYLGERK